MPSSRSFRPALLASLLLAPLAALAQPAQTYAAVRQYQAVERLQAMADAGTPPALAEVAEQVRKANNPDVLKDLGTLLPVQVQMICSNGQHAALISSRFAGDGSDAAMLQQLTPAWNDAQVFALQCGAMQLSLQGTALAGLPAAQRPKEELDQMRLRTSLLLLGYADVASAVALTEVPQPQRQALLRDALAAAKQAVRSMPLHARTQYQQMVRDRVGDVPNADTALVAPLLAAFSATECDDACTLLDAEPVAP